MQAKFCCRGLLAEVSSPGTSCVPPSIWARRQSEANGEDKLNAKTPMAALHVDEYKHPITQQLDSNPLPLHLAWPNQLGKDANNVNLCDEPHPWCTQSRRHFALRR